MHTPNLTWMVTSKFKDTCAGCVAPHFSIQSPISVQTQIWIFSPPPCLSPPLTFLLILPIPLFNTAHLPPDERNLLYVAATRAKRQLIITPTLLDVLHRAGVNINCCCSIAILLQVRGSDYGRISVPIDGFHSIFSLWELEDITSSHNLPFSTVKVAMESIYNTNCRL